MAQWFRIVHDPTYGRAPAAHVGWFWASGPDAYRVQWGPLRESDYMLCHPSGAPRITEVGHCGSVVGATHGGGWYAVWERVSSRWQQRGWMWAAPAAALQVARRLRPRGTSSWAVVDHRTGKPLSGLSALGQGIAEWVETRELGAPHYTPEAAALIWDYLEQHDVISKQALGSIEEVRFGAAGSGTVNAAEWAASKMALGWDVAAPMVLAASPSSLSAECESEQGAVAFSPMGVDDAKEIYGLLRSKCGAILSPRDKPAPGPQPEPEPELKLAGVEPWVIGVLAAGAGFVLYRILKS